jgi:hypothetical protein
MKNIYNKFSVILVGALLLALASCTEEVLRDDSPVPEGGIQAYIPVTNSASLLFLPDAPTSFTITIGRQNTQGRVELPLLVTEEKGLLTLSDIAVFEDGQALTELEVDFSAMALGQTTTLKLAIKETTDRYLYGLSEYSITVLRDYKWVDVGSADVQDLLLGGGATAKVTIQQAEGALLFRLKDVMSEVFLAADPADPDIEKCKGYHLQFYLDTTYTDVSKTYRSCKADSLPRGFQDLGLTHYGYELYWVKGSYGGAFSNEGNVYTINALLTDNRSPAYYWNFEFTWTEGFPGDPSDKPDPYKGETIVIDNLKRTMNTGDGYFLGLSRYYSTDEYGSRVPIYLGDYVVLLEGDDSFISLDILTFFEDDLAIPAGVYAINNSDDGNSVRAGNYAEVTTYGTSSYVELAIEGVILYLVSGTVEVEYDDQGNCTITVDAVTAKGSVIQATWTGDLQITDSTSAKASGAAAKAGLKAKAKAGINASQRPQKLSLIK